jgi:hypothetical protein
MAAQSGRAALVYDAFGVFGTTPQGNIWRFPFKRSKNGAENSGRIVGKRRSPDADWLFAGRFRRGPSAIITSHYPLFGESL